MPRLALVVDDSMLIRHTVCRFLEERGFSVESASQGLDALNILERFRPDLIVTDLQMPRMDGNRAHHRTDGAEGVSPGEP
jgi:CheY-like chemotaxis protein